MIDPDSRQALQLLRCLRGPGSILILAWTQWAGTSHSLKASVITLLLGSTNDVTADIPARDETTESLLLSPCRSVLKQLGENLLEGNPSHTCLCQHHFRSRACSGLMWVLRSNTQEAIQTQRQLLRTHVVTQLTPDTTELVTKCAPEFGWHRLHLSATTPLRCVRVGQQYLNDWQSESKQREKPGQHQHSQGGPCARRPLSRCIAYS